MTSTKKFHKLFLTFCSIFLFFSLFSLLLLSLPPFHIQLSSILFWPSKIMYQLEILVANYLYLLSITQPKNVLSFPLSAPLIYQLQCVFANCVLSRIEGFKTELKILLFLKLKKILKKNFYFFLLLWKHILLVQIPALWKTLHLSVLCFMFLMQDIPKYF